MMDRTRFHVHIIARLHVFILQMSFGVFFYLFHQVAFKKFKLVYIVSWSYSSMPYLFPTHVNPSPLRELFPPPHILWRKAFHLVVSRLLLFVLLEQNKVSLCNPGWSGTHVD